MYTTQTYTHTHVPDFHDNYISGVGCRSASSAQQEANVEPHAGQVATLWGRERGRERGGEREGERERERDFF